VDHPLKTPEDVVVAVVVAWPLEMKVPFERVW
jgi:hypothetical protein